MNSLILAPVRIRFAPHPLRGDVFEAQADAGQSLAEMLGDAVPEARVWIGEHEIAREDWPAIKPEPGDVVAVRVVPRGGGGKNPLSTILTLGAIAAVAAMPLSLAGSPFLGALARAGVGLGASLLINALVPPQVPETPKAGPQFVNRPGISGIQNRMAPYEPVPRVYGSRRVYPPLAARPYTEVVGQEQYLRLLFSFGYGPLDISDIRIGETPIDEYEDVRYQVGAPLSLYSNDIWQEDLAVAINEDAEGTWTTRTTQVNADEISLDFLLPQGLWGADKTPETPDDCYILLKIEYSPAGANTWSNARTGSGLALTSSLIGTQPRQGIDPGSDKFIVHGALKETGYFGLRWKVAKGQYDVRVQRVASGDPTGDSAEVFTDLTWTALRTIIHSEPVEHPGTVLMAMRIRATGQLNGVIDQLNAQVQSRLQVWNGSAWIEQATSNCAWVYADILCGSANARAVARSKLDVASLSAWAAEGWEFHHVYDSATSVFDAARDVASAGRAAWAMVNGKYGVVRDTVDPAPVQVFTPRNSRNFESRRDYHDQPHALRVRFINAEGEQDEVTVYDDGYNSGNATKFEVLELLRGIKDEDTAWKLGRYHIAQGRLRPFTFTIETDFEHLVATRGDTVLVAHDEPMWGSGWGRITAINGTTVTLDDTAAIDPATNYVARLRLSDGTIALRNIVNPPGGDVSLFELESVPAGLAVGDLVVIGISTQETRELKIVEVEPGPDLSARLRMVDVAPEIYEADTGPIPPYEDRITFPLDYSKILPPAPVIVEVRSDSTIYKPEADGTFRALVQIAFRLPAGVSLPGLQVEGRFIRYDNNGHAVGKWQTVPPVESADGVINFEKVSVGKTYRFEIRARNGEKVSPWAGINHTVLGGVRRKIVSFRQETAPTASESFDGDRWVKPSTGEEFEWRDNAWVPVATHDTPARLLEKLTGQITESQLNQDLSEKINLTYDAAAIEAMLLAGPDGAKVHQGDTAPADPVAKPIWIDTSGALPVLKRWNGSAWVADTTAHIEGVRARVTAVEGELDTQATAVSDLDTRVTTVEGTTTTQASQITALSARVDAVPSFIYDGGFEAGGTDWFLGNWTITSSNPHSGTKSARIEVGGASTNNVLRSKRLTPVAPGDRIMVSAWIRRAAGATAGLIFAADFLDATGGYVRSRNFATGLRPASADTWEFFRVAVTVFSSDISGAPLMRPVISAWDSTGGYWQVDDVAVDLIPRESDFPNFEATATAVDQLDARVTTAEGQITAHSGQITDLQAEIDNINDLDSAQAGAISSLEADVTALEGTTTSQATQITGLSARIDGLPVLVENGGFENGLTGWSTTMPIQTGSVSGDTGSAACYIAANASYTGDTFLASNNLRFDTKAGDRFALSFRATYTSAIPPSGSYVQIYITFENAAGTDLFSGVVARITRADVDAAGGGTAWVTARAITGAPAGAVRGKLAVGVYNHTTPGSYWNWDDVRVELLPRENDFPAIAATAEAVDQLDARVTTAEGNITSQASSITSLSAEIDNANDTLDGHAAAISSLQTEVNSIDGEVSALTTSTNAISARVGVLPSIIENGSFENGSQGWVLGNWTIATDGGHGGTKRAVISAGGANTNSVLRSARQTPVAPGDRIMVSAWIRRAAGATNGLLFTADFLDATGGYVRSRNFTSNLTPTNVNEWEFFRIVVTINSGDVAGAPLMRPGVSAWNSTGGPWAVDDVRVELLPREGDFPTISANSAAIVNEQTVRADADSALASDIQTVSTTVNGHTTTIQQHTSSIDGLQGQYTVKIDTGNRVIGFGLASGPPDQAASSFLVKADRFAVGAPGASSGFPFIVDTTTNQVVMDNAFIRNLTIDRLATGGLSTLVADGSFEAGTRDWSKYGAAAFATSGAHTGTQYLYTGATGAGTVIVAENKLVSDIVAGETVLIEGAVKYTGGEAAGQARVEIRWQNASGGAAGFSNLSWSSGDMAGGAWLVKSGMFTAPAGTVSMRVRCHVVDHTASGTFWNWDSIICRRAVGGTLIEQDAISTGHVKARVLTADKLVLGGITYNEVGLNQMTVPVFAYTSGELVVNSLATATAQSLSITTIGRPVQIFFSVEIKKDSSGQGAFDIVIKRGSTTLVAYSTDIYGEYMVRTVAYVDTAPGSGAQTYSVTVGGIDGVVSRYRRRMLTVSEVRR